MTGLPLLASTTHPIGGNAPLRRTPLCQPNCVVRPELSGRRAAVAGAVRLARALDPQERVNVARAGVRCGHGPKRAPGRVAPGVVGRRSGAVAAGVDNEWGSYAERCRDRVTVV